MKITRQQSIQWSLVSLGILTLVSLFFAFVVQIPGLQSIRDSIDQARLTEQLLSDQKQNIQTLKVQLGKIEDEQDSLAKEIWKFENEEEFFAQWDQFASAHGISVELPNVADVIPGNNPVIRSLEIQLVGSSTNVFKAIADLQKLQPLLAIQGLAMQPGVSTNEVDVLLTIDTIWQ